MTQELRHFTVNQATPGAAAQITLDGTDISAAVFGFQMNVDARSRVPQVMLELAAGGADLDVLAGIQVVNVAEPEPLDTGPAAAVFLSAIDAEQLEKAALNNPNLTNEPNALTASMLDVLIGWANGRA